MLLAPIAITTAKVKRRKFPTTITITTTTTTTTTSLTALELLNDPTSRRLPYWHIWVELALPPPRLENETDD